MFSKSHIYVLGKYCERSRKDFRMFSDGSWTFLDRNTYIPEKSCECSGKDFGMFLDVHEYSQKDIQMFLKSVVYVLGMASVHL